MNLRAMCVGRVYVSARATTMMIDDDVFVASHLILQLVYCNHTHRDGGNQRKSVPVNPVIRCRNQSNFMSPQRQLQVILMLAMYR